MKNKDKTISLRLNEELYSVVNTNSNKLHMTNSEYIRSLITNAVPVTENHNQKIASIMCRIHIRLAELGLEDENITKEVTIFSSVFIFLYINIPPFFWQSRYRTEGN